MSLFHFGSRFSATLAVLLSIGLAQEPSAQSTSMLVGTNRCIRLGTQTPGPIEFLATLEFSNLQREAVAPAVLSLAINGSLSAAWQELGRELILEIPGRTDDQIRFRTELVRLHVTAALQPGDVVTVSASSATPDGSLTGSSNTEILGATAGTPPPEPCVSAFLSALGTAKGPDGRVTFSNALSCATIRAAAEALRQCLDEAGLTTVNDTMQCTLPDGTVLSVSIDARADGAGNASSIEGAADVVIAIGGAAHASSSSDGGRARAVNSRAGGATIAIGGLGGQHQAGSAPGQPGNGGAATSTSSASGAATAGDSVAVAGHGGNGPGAGGDGGAAVASTDGPKSRAYSQGGDGGDPVNAPATPGTTGTPTAGGKGGNATATRDTQSVEALGAGQAHGAGPITGGQHGGGAQASANNAGVVGTNGTLIPNS